MRREVLRRITVGSVGGLGLVALLGSVVGRRISAGARPRGVELTVTNPGDGGPGSLREAIFTANLMAAPTRITFVVPRVTLLTPLPPIVGGRGLEIVAADSVTEIDASSLSSGPVLDLQSRGAVVRGLRIRGAAAIGILVRAADVRLLDVGFARCRIGIEQGAGGDDLTVEGGTFADNAVGARLQPRRGGTAIRRSRFDGHADAGLWAVGAEDAAAAGRAGFIVSGSRFDNNRLGVVAGNLVATIQDNDISASKDAGIYLAGRGANVRRNRVRGGAGVGVLAAATEGVVISDNEIDHNRAVGIVISSAHNTVVEHNRVYQNGYGIAVVFGAARSPNRVAANTVLGQSSDGLFVVGASPVLEGNRAINNRLAGVRILDFLPRRGAVRPADPLLASNTLEGNGVNEPVRGVFRSGP